MESKDAEARNEKESQCLMFNVNQINSKSCISNFTVDGKINNLYSIVYNR